MTASFAKEQLRLLAPTTVTDAAASVQASRGNGIARRLSGAVQFVAAYPRRRAALAELGRLTDRQLSDIGLTRGELRSIFARRAA